MKIAILGNGWIGNKLKEHLGGEIISSVTTLVGLENTILEMKPEVLINTVGHTGGNNVDACELNRDKTLVSNSLIPLIAAEVAVRNKVKFVHISSGCIYDGCPTALTEEDPPNFFDLFYSRTKIYAEGALKPMINKYGFLILRPRIPLDNKPHLRNILTKLIGYRKVIDVPNSVTYIPDLLCAVEALLKEDAWGIFNVVNDGTLKYPDLMEAYRVYRPEFQYEITTLEELGIKRTNVILDSSKLGKYWTARNINWLLDDCVREYTSFGGP